MGPRRSVLVMFGVVALVGCAGGAGNAVYVGDPWAGFHDDDWLYYHDEDDEDFLAGLTDEQKEALRQKWDSLSPEEKQAIRDRWNKLNGDERARVREAWRGLDAEQRQQVLTSMQTRARGGTLRPVTPVQAGPSRFPARAGGFDRAGAGARSGSLGRGGGRLGGRGGGRR